MITSIALLVVTVILVAWSLAMDKRIKEVEDIVFNQLDGTHYPAIRHEFESVWMAIEDLQTEEK